MKLYTLTNPAGMTAAITDFGGINLSLTAPDRDGNFADVVLGFDEPADYLDRNDPYLGAIIGRYGNRIGNARFILDGREYNLAKNMGDHQLHGGLKAFDKVMWAAKPIDGPGFQGLELTYLSPDMEEAYPGNLDVKVTYKLNDANELSLDYTASTDKTTFLNLTHHGYYNLKGHDAGDILGHEVMIAGDTYAEAGPDMIPTGRFLPVAGTPMDFTSMKPVGRDIDADDAQMRLASGFDFSWVVRREKPGELVSAVQVYEPSSGRLMEVLTTEPAAHLYTGNFLDGSLTGKNECAYGRHAGLCVETQHFADSPNQPDFPSTRLEPGQKFRSTTIYRFGVR